MKVFKENNKIKAIKGEKVTYYKYVDWTQPVKTTNGNMGQDYFATASSSSHSGWVAWHVFASSPSQWHSGGGLPQWFAWYNPNPLKISKLSFVGHSAGNIKKFVVQASDNNSNWVDIKTVTNTITTGDFEVDLSSNETPYKYWRLYITSCYYNSGGTYYALIQGGLQIIAQEAIQGSVYNSDYSISVPVYYAVKE